MGSSASGKARWAVGVFGALMVASWIPMRHDAYTIVLPLGGVALIVVAVLGANLKIFKFGKDGVHVEQFQTEEGSVTAELAEPEGESGYQAKIASDDEGPVRPSPVDTDVIAGLNYAAGQIALEAIFARATAPDGELSGCEIHLFLHDPETDELFSAIGTSRTDATWKPGHGATGTAFVRKQFVLAIGDLASDGTYGLSPAQQEQYKHLRAVASAPVFNAGGDIIGVVTALSDASDSPLEQEAAELHMVGVSLLTSRILVELLQWFDDDRQEG